jgi:UDP-glucose 4-epimerase|tara:strand:+ start:31 stop:903 length:873 start_codon:yes stop_codon:yes gene_type:complete
MDVLVTGATGYIGSHVCKLLKERGHHVTGWDTNIHGEYNDITEYVDWFDERDVTDPYCSDNFDAVVHLAGRGIVPQSLKEPTEYYRVNAMGTANMLDKVNTPHFIFASTSSAWEMASPYAKSKVAAEDIIKEKADGYTIFRFFNVSGTNGFGRQLGPPSHLIRVAALACVNESPSVNIFGTDYDTRDGTCIRDYIHVVDLASAIVKAAETGPINTPYECLGSNEGYTVHDVLDMMETVTGKFIDRTQCGRREGDAVASVVDTLSQHCVLTKTLEDMCRDQYNLELRNKID